MARQSSKKARPRPRDEVIRLVPGTSKVAASDALRYCRGSIERAVARLLASSATAGAVHAKPEPMTEGPVQLTAQQVALVNRVRGGESVFITGEAGTGKSVTTRAIAALFASQDIAITAPTGIAALNVDGLTIHSWAGVGLGSGDTETLLQAVMRNRKARKRWCATKLLIIDEVSMLTDRLFQSLSDIGKAVRSGERGARDAPFGGLQLVCVGDFCQLPPVGVGSFCRFCFEAPAWAEIFGPRCAPTSLLTTQLRQKGDVRFAALLNELRRGVLSAAARAELLACHVATKPRPNDGIVPTKLYCTNRNVDAENAAQLRKVAKPAVIFTARDSYGDVGFPKQQCVESLRSHAEKKVKLALRLKIGAQVLLLRNMHSDGLVNGSRGVVESYVGHDGDKSAAGGRPRVVVRWDSGSVVEIVPVEHFVGKGSTGTVTRVQLPLRLAWALTVHKAQGMTLSRAQLSLGNSFEYGQVYVALSRLTSLDGLWLTDRSVKVKAHPDVLAFYGYKYDSASSVGGGKSAYQMMYGDQPRQSRTTVGASSSSNSSASASAPAASASALTAEQRERIARNKRQALERRQQRASASECASAEAAPPLPHPASRDLMPLGDYDTLCRCAPGGIEKVFPSWRQNIQFVLEQNDTAALKRASEGLRACDRSSPAAEAALHFFESIVSRHGAHLEAAASAAPGAAPGAAPPHQQRLLAAGTRVRLVGLQSSAALNGRCGTLLSFGAAVGRYAVAIDAIGASASGETKYVRVRNLELLAPSSAAAASAAPGVAAAEVTLPAVTLVTLEEPAAAVDRVGTRVRARGLVAASHINGQCGCVESADAERVQVRFDAPDRSGSGTALKSLRRENLVAVASGGGGGEGAAQPRCASAFPRAGVATAAAAAAASASASAAPPAASPVANVPANVPASKTKSAAPGAKAHSRPSKRKRERTSKRPSKLEQGDACCDEERELAGLRVAELRARLKEKGWPTKGKKAELVARLLASEDRV